MIWTQAAVVLESLVDPGDHGCDQGSQLGLSGLNLQTLELHGHAHVATDRQLLLHVSLGGRRGGERERVSVPRMKRFGV